MKIIFSLVLYLMICSSSFFVDFFDNIKKRFFSSKEKQIEDLTKNGPSIFQQVERQDSKAKFDLVMIHNEMLKATRDNELTNQLIELREGIFYLSYYTPLEKKSYYVNLLNRICQKRELALLAFNTALKLEDSASQCMALYGLAHLKNIDSIKTIINISKNKNNEYGLAGNLLVSEFARFAPVNGENGFIEIFRAFYGNDPTEPFIGWNLLLYMWELLKIVDGNPTKFSDSEFEIILNMAKQYGSNLFKNSPVDQSKFLKILNDYENKREAFN